MRDWRLRSDVSGNLLAWAARLHELAVFIARSQYHKHGVYVLTHGDLAGFSKREQSMMGALVRLHRRKFTLGVLDESDAKMREQLTRLPGLLRVAAVLHRSRTDSPLPIAKGDAQARTLSLEFPEYWLQQDPLTRADLVEEAQYLSAAYFELTFQ